MVVIWRTAKGAISRKVSELISAVRQAAEGDPVMTLPRLRAVPLAPFERDGLRAALRKSGLPCDDVGEAGPLFWRFETEGDVPIGFGGLEIHGPDALLRSVVTLPPLRRSGFGRAIVAALEQEATLNGCDAIYLLTMDTAYFARMGYTVLSRGAVPEAVRKSHQFSLQAPEGVEAMVKPLA
jgi:N-acetylglutamate synthase-like GNAT family acetyltransferase